jgi:hypothetical protein
MNTVKQNAQVTTAPPSLSDYQGNLSELRDYGPLMLDGQPGRLFDEVVERVNLPETIQWALGGVIATDELALYADKNTPPARYRRWGTPGHPPNTPKIYAMYVDKWCCAVWQYQGLWFIQRDRRWRDQMWCQALSFPIAQSILCARSLGAAKRLAVFYSLTEVEKAGGIGWTTSSVIKR